MTSYTTERFRKLLAQSPKEVQQQAKEAYLRFEKDPSHPSLRFKKSTRRDPFTRFASREIIEH